MNDLMKQMLEETKLDEDDPMNTVTVTDKEIEQRLAKLKDIDPSELKREYWDQVHTRENGQQFFLSVILLVIAIPFLDRILVFYFKVSYTKYSVWLTYQEGLL